jgi:hypothetical protein
MNGTITFTKAAVVDMLLSGAVHTRLSATVIALVSVLSGSAYRAELAAQSAEPRAANVLYQTGTKRGGFEDWSLTATPDWQRLKGMLLNDGTRGAPSFAPIIAPYSPESADYAVEAEIRVIRDGHSFGVVVRARDNRGYAVGVGQNLMRRTPNICYLDGSTSWHYRSGCIDPREEVPVFNPSPDWHTYRIEVNGNVITLLIDGKFMTCVADNKFLSAGSVGLWSSGYQLEVRNFRVIALIENVPSSSPRVERRC